MKSGIIHKKRLTKRAPCNLYTAPSASSTIAAFVPTTLTWDPSCYSQLASDSPSAIDIYLYNATKPIYAWRGVGLSTGRLDVVLDSAWWGNTTQSRVHLQFLPSGGPLWDTAVPSGPIFLASYNGSYPSSSPSSSSTPTDTDGFHFSSIDLSPTSGGLSGGKLAAAVVMPLLAVASLVIGYVVYTRIKTRKTTKRYSAAVDQRMSALNVAGWQPGLVGGGGSARPSMSSQRPGSHRHSAAFTARHSAFLAAAPQAHLAAPPSPRMEMTQNPNRASRISFAPSADTPSKRYSLAAGAGPMNANKGHGRGPGSTASAFSAYSNNTFAPPAAHLRNNNNGGHRPMPSGSSALRRQVDDLQLSPDQADSPIALAGHFSPAPSRSPVPQSPASSNFAFNTSPTKRAVPGRANLVPDQQGQQKTESVVSQSAALMDELNAMGPAIQAIVSGEADGEKMEVVGRTGWDDDDDDDGDEMRDQVGAGGSGPRQAPRPPMASPYLAAMDGQGHVDSGKAAGLGKAKKGLLAGLGGWRKRDGAKENTAGGKLVIGQPQIVPGSNLDEASRNGVMVGRGYYDAQ